MEKLSNLINIGKELEKQLNEIGINNFEQLKKAGSKKTWLRIKTIDTSACFNRLCALEGAIQGVRWYNLCPIIKNDLRKFYQENKNI